MTAQHPPCKLCAAVQSRYLDDDTSFCADCIERKELFYKAMDVTEYVAHRLLLASRRVVSGKYIVRCEVIATYANYSLNSGHQCANTANTERDGRKVCTQHSRQSHVTYVASRVGPCADLLAVQLRNAAERSPAVKAAMKLALEQLKPKE
jgi:hypothetical protein